MKLFLIFLITCLSIVFPQDEKSITKMDKFVSNTGQIMTLENFKLPALKSKYSNLEVKVRRATSQDEISFFLMITKPDKYSGKTGSIAEEDLEEIINALNVLIEKSKTVKKVSDYLETKFTTDDGFEVGYYIDKKPVWFIKLERYGSSTVFFDNYNQIKTTMSLALAKIKELK